MMRVKGLPVVVSCLFLFGLTAFAADESSSKAGEGKPPAPLFELSIGSSQKVVEVSQEMPLRYSVTRGVNPQPAVLKRAGPVAWTITDARGKVVLETKVEIKEVVGQTGIPSPPWSEGTLSVYASAPFEAEVAESDAADAARATVSGVLTAKAIEVAIKPDGWREATYKRWLEQLHKTMRAKLDPLSFEFPELRDLEKVTMNSSIAAGVGRFKLTREYLEIDDKNKTARLRKGEGFLEFAAVDPWAVRDVQADARGLVEGGLVALDFRYQMTTNKWLAEKLLVVEPEMIKEMGGTLLWPEPKPDDGLPPMPEPPRFDLPRTPPSSTPNYR